MKPLVITALIFVEAAFLIGCATFQTSRTNVAVNTPERISPRLLRPLGVSGFTVADRISPEGAQKLMNERIYTGNIEEHFDFLAKGTNEPPALIHTETVNQYLAAVRSGAEVQANAGLLGESWFRDYASALLFLSKASPAHTNLIAEDFVRWLPVDILAGVSQEECEALEKDAAGGRLINDYIRNGKVYGLKRINDTLYEFADDCRDYRIHLLARGDIDGDGYEDLLVSATVNYRGGSLCFSYPLVVKRTGSSLNRYGISHLDLAATNPFNHQP